MSVTAFAGGWQRDARGWWYQHNNGSYTTNGWEQINGKYYYFDGAGYMLANTTTPDGYYVNADGAWVQETDGNYINLTRERGVAGNFVKRASFKEGADYYQVTLSNGGNLRFTKNCSIEWSYCGDESGLVWDSGVSNADDFFHNVVKKKDKDRFPTHILAVNSYDSRGYATSVIWRDVYSSLYE